MADLLLQWMRRKGVPVTREKYLGLAFGTSLPNPWTPEHEAELPEELQTHEDVHDSELDLAGDASVYQEPEHPREASGKWTEKGGKESPYERWARLHPPKQGKYGLVPGDDKKFEKLQAEWGALNNQYMEPSGDDPAPVDDPSGLKATALMFQMEAICKEIHGLRVDPGGPGGIGLPGGPRDVLVIGAGPGGLSAGINGAAEGLDTLVVEAELTVGGQAKLSSRIENYGGFPVGVRGKKLSQDMFMQAQRLGAEFKLGVRVTGMTIDEDGMKHVTLSNGETVDSRTVIVAGGLEFRRLPSFPGSEGSGVIYGDPEQLFNEAAGKSIVVIGGSNGAAQAALGCAPVADHVYVLARSPIENSMSAYVIAGIRANPKITVLEKQTVVRIDRDEHGNPQAVETSTGAKLSVGTIGVFAGSVPKTEWVPVDVAREKLEGGKKGERLRTNRHSEVLDAGDEPIPGLYAVGDMQEEGNGRIGAAYGEGQVAVRHANIFLDAQKQKAASKTDGVYRDADRTAHATTLTLITELFALDRANPWFGQTIEGVKSPGRKYARDAYEEPEHPRAAGGKWTTKAKESPYERWEHEHGGGQYEELGSMALGGEERFLTPVTRKVDALRDEMGVADVPWKQRQALDMYTSDSTTFNQYSRVGSPETKQTPSALPEHFWSQRLQLDRLVDSYKTPRDLTVYRTVGWQRTQNLLDHVGDAFSDPGFMSTTLDKSKIDKPGSYIEIQVPKGSHAFPVGSLSNFPEEAEILFPRNSRLEIISHEPRELANTERFVARLLP